MIETNKPLQYDLQTIHEHFLGSILRDNTTLFNNNTNNNTLVYRLPRTDPGGMRGCIPPPAKKIVIFVQFWCTNLVRSSTCGNFFAFTPPPPVAEIPVSVTVGYYANYKHVMLVGYDMVLLSTAHIDRCM